MSKHASLFPISHTSVPRLCACHSCRTQNIGMKDLPIVRFPPRHPPTNLIKPEYVMKGESFRYPHPMDERRQHIWVCFQRWPVAATPPKIASVEPKMRVPSHRCMHTLQPRGIQSRKHCAHLLAVCLFSSAMAILQVWLKSPAGSPPRNASARTASPLL